MNLLDLNPGRPGEDGDAVEPFEIFEAGTGMGSLTLHMARAIHAANPPLPMSLRDALCASPLRRIPEADTPPSVELEEEQQQQYDAWRSSRKAILHTLDRNHKHTRGAYKIVRNFRRAQYLSDIDFHIGTVDDYITSRLEANGGKPFLSRAILDLPAADEHAGELVKALHPGATLIVFNPSVSQIADFKLWVDQSKQPLRLEKVVELPPSTTHDGVHDGVAGGRHWDVKVVVPREKDGDADAKPVQIMRPKVGDRMGGGGFVGVLRRWPETEQLQSDVEAEES